VPRFESLGFAIENMQVVSHTAPAESRLSGLLGLDFFAGKKLSLHFKPCTTLLRDA
jgi:hypothetical protein